MKRHALCTLCGLAALGATSGAARTITTRYTILDIHNCRTLEIIPEGDSVRRRCPGLASIELFVNEGDGRSEIDAGFDDGEWESVSAFNTIGDRIEWRLSGGRPFAIIYRLRTSATENAPAGSALIVEKIGHRGAPGCRIGLIDGVLSDANARARALADRLARDAHCPVSAGTP